MSYKGFHAKTVLTINEHLMDLARDMFNHDHYSTLIGVLFEDILIKMYHGKDHTRFRWSALENIVGTPLTREDKHSLIQILRDQGYEVTPNSCEDSDKHITIDWYCYKEQVETGLSVISDYPISLKKLSKEV